MSCAEVASLIEAVKLIEVFFTRSDAAARVGVVTIVNVSFVANYPVFAVEIQPIAAVCSSVMVGSLYGKSKFVSVDSQLNGEVYCRFGIISTFSVRRLTCFLSGEEACLPCQPRLICNAGTRTVVVCLGKEVSTVACAGTECHSCNFVIRAHEETDPGINRAGSVAGESVLHFENLLVRNKGYSAERRIRRAGSDDNQFVCVVGFNNSVAGDLLVIACSLVVESEIDICLRFGDFDFGYDFKSFGGSGYGVRSLCDFGNGPGSVFACGCGYFAAFALEGYGRVFSVVILGEVFRYVYFTADCNEVALFNGSNAYGLLSVNHPHCGKRELISSAFVGCLCEVRICSELDIGDFVAFLCLYGYYAVFYGVNVKGVGVCKFDKIVKVVCGACKEVAHHKRRVLVLGFVHTYNHRSGKNVAGAGDHIAAVQMIPLVGTEVQSVAQIQICFSVIVSHCYFPLAGLPSVFVAVGAFGKIFDTVYNRPTISCSGRNVVQTGIAVVHQRAYRSVFVAGNKSDTNPFICNGVVLDGAFYDELIRSDVAEHKRMTAVAGSNRSIGFVAVCVKSLLVHKFFSA